MEIITVVVQLVALQGKSAEVFFSKTNTTFF